VIHLLRAAWGPAVGEELARRTEVLALEGRTLRIRVPDVSWGKVLHRMERDILIRLRRVGGEATPGRLGFTVGQVATPPEAAADKPGPSPEISAGLREEASVIEDPELRERFLEAATRYLGRRRRHG
jgi:predicted nucleic acid-binding Zn ribbon protein